MTSSGLEISSAMSIADDMPVCSVGVVGKSFVLVMRVPGSQAGDMARLMMMSDHRCVVGFSKNAAGIRFENSGHLIG